MKNLLFVQLTSVIRYEIQMQWRRGSLRAIAILLMSVSILFSLGKVFQDPNWPQLVAHFDSTQLSEAIISVAITNTLPIMLIWMFVLPLIAAETVPVDSEYHVQELIGTLPIPLWLYITGKILSVVLPTLFFSILATAITDGYLYVNNGAFQIDRVLGFWLAALLPCGLFASIVSVLLPANQPSRRRALLFGLASMPICFYFCYKLLFDFYYAAVARPLYLTVTAEYRNQLPDYPSLISLHQLILFAEMLGLVIVLWVGMHWLLARRVEN